MSVTSMGRWGRGLAAVATLMALTACGSTTGPQNVEDVVFADVLGLKISEMTRLSSGVYIQTTREGVDPAVEDDSTIRVNYSLWLPDGTPMASGSFNQPVGSLIDGFRLGVLGMKTTEIRWIVVPSELGYGSTGSGSIPPNSVLVFQVELLEITGSGSSSAPH